MGTWQVEQPPNAKVVVTADWCGESERGALVFLNGPKGATVMAAMWAPGEWHSVHLVQEDRALAGWSPMDPATGERLAPVTERLME